MPKKVVIILTVLPATAVVTAIAPVTPIVVVSLPATDLQKSNLVEEK